jgi:2-keto-3-deoxy-L-rhamnonate aldolase RhmA
MKFPEIGKAAGSVLTLLLVSIPAMAQQGGSAPPAKLYNTAKQKLLEGKQVFSHTISRPDPAAYCEEAPHYDYTWFEMQHSTLTWADVEKMIATCPRVGAIPMIRMPDELESSIQKATDLGVLGIIMPTVETVEKAEATARYARYPPEARRSSGGGQARRIWGVDGIDYHATFNDNMLVVVMIETPAGVANAYDIARVRGVDVVIIGNNDLSQFSGLPQKHPRYQQMLEEVRDATLKAGKIFGNAGAQYREGYSVSKDSFFFQNGPSNDGWVNPRTRGRGNQAEGEESVTRPRQ